MAQVYIVHGYTANADKHWFPWLEEQLTTIGISCQRLNMPDSENPSLDRWLAHLAENLEVNENTIFVGHSLGCIAILNFLAKQQEQIKGAVFVSGFYQPLPNLPELSAFTNYYAILPSPPAFPAYILSALDDSIVAHKHSDALAIHLQADYVRLNKGGHFLDREGATELPIVLELVKKLMKQ
ncbi:RBBP9/YdeN family alpha/beta hydrolase [Mannheimia granulomatis]|uniref:RBBP9/YdeN family alpha/beta hydrolase n=1 Tax=Mannheimia granulomatis TaxID=85402 RepID=UPI00047E8C4B|nr:alpha/beta hydrolase [Mannheimia granulomatis]QLB18144.1 esterase [Mannheimia granulomatis]